MKIHTKWVGLPWFTLSITYVGLTGKENVAPNGQVGASEPCLKPIVLVSQGTYWLIMFPWNFIDIFDEMKNHENSINIFANIKKVGYICWIFMLIMMIPC